MVIVDPQWSVDVFFFQCSNGLNCTMPCGKQELVSLREDSCLQVLVGAVMPSDDLATANIAADIQAQSAPICMCYLLHENTAQQLRKNCRASASKPGFLWCSIFRHHTGSKIMGTWCSICLKATCCGSHLITLW